MQKEMPRLGNAELGRPVAHRKVLRGLGMRVSLAGCWLLVISSALVIGCDDDVRRAEFVEPVYSEPCRFAGCSANSECRVSEAGTPSCLCAVGYADSTCGSCEAGFHRDARDRCVPDKSCAEQDVNPCGPNGDCMDTDGVIECACETGYEGPRCTLCADRYARDGAERCLPLFIIENSPPGSPANPGDGGTCEPGYAGTNCTHCAAGYHAADGRCVADETCRANSCPQHAGCSVVEREVLCQCLPAHAGSDCTECASGFHTAAGDCAPDETCEPDSCPEHATCRIVSGAAACECHVGYAAPDCTACGSGYHAAGDSCAPDETCSPAACPGHANCVVMNGQTECHCKQGWSGAQCNLCGDIGSESIAFGGVSGWPTALDTCSTRTELSVSQLTLRSRQGSGSVLLCAPSTYNGLTTPHVELEASSALAAQLVFAQPVISLSFDYAARLNGLSLELLADGSTVRTIELPRKSKGTVALELPTPAETIALRSRTNVLQHVGVDNIVYHFEQCQ
jgi:hypothetical protein